MLYWCIEGLQFDVVKFFKFFVTLFLMKMGSTAVVFIASATFYVLAIANLLSIFVFVVMLVGLQYAHFTYFQLIKLHRCPDNADRQTTVSLS